MVEVGLIGFNSSASGEPVETSLRLKIRSMFCALTVSTCFFKQVSVHITFFKLYIRYVFNYVQNTFKGVGLLQSSCLDDLSIL